MTIDSLSLLLLDRDVLVPSGIYLSGQFCESPFNFVGCRIVGINLKGPCRWLFWTNLVTVRRVTIQSRQDWDPSTVAYTLWKYHLSNRKSIFHSWYYRVTYCFCTPPGPKIFFGAQILSVLLVNSGCFIPWFYVRKTSFVEQLQLRKSMLQIEPCPMSMSLLSLFLRALDGGREA